MVYAKVTENLKTLLNVPKKETESEVKESLIAIFLALFVYTRLRKIIPKIMKTNIPNDMPHSLVA